MAGWKPTDCGNSTASTRELAAAEGRLTLDELVLAMAPPGKLLSPFHRSTQWWLPEGQTDEELLVAEVIERLWRREG